MGVMRRMSSPRLKTDRVVAAMSSCNAYPVIMEISPTIRAGCEKQIGSCNASEGDSGATISISGDCDFKGSCNASAGIDFLLRQ